MKNIILCVLIIIGFSGGCASTIKELSSNNSCVMIEGKHFTVGYNTLTGSPGIQYYNGTIIRYNTDKLEIIIANKGVDSSVIIRGDLEATPTPALTPTLTPTPVQ